MSEGYVVVIEQAEGNLSAYVPQLPGLAVTAPDRDTLLRDVAEAVRLHVDALEALGEPVPPPLGSGDEAVLVTLSGVRSEA